MSELTASAEGGRRLDGRGKNNIAAAMDDYLKPLEQAGYFSGSVLVVREGGILLTEGYGMANVEHDVKNGRDTIFRLASLSKSFTAASVMLLHEQGVIDADDTIDRYLPDFPNGGSIKIHHLLTHTSGLAHPVGLNSKASMKLEDVVRKFRDQPLVFPPGERFQYANSGYILLTHLIEQVSGKTYEQFLQDYFFGPLGMCDSGYDVHKRILKRRASGYSAWEDRLIPGEFMDMSTQAGAAGLYSTTRDLQLWDEALHSDRLLSSQSRARLFTPSMQNYGYGWYIDRQSTGGGMRRRIWHGGMSDSGYSVRMTAFPDERLTIIVLSNFLLSPLQTIHRDLASIAFGEPVDLPCTPRNLLGRPQQSRYDALAGTYQAFMPIPVTVEQDRLFITIFGFKLELFLHSETAEQIDCYAKAAYVHVSFQKKASGEIAGAVIRWLGEDGYFAELTDSTVD